MKTPFFIVVIFFALFLASCGQNNENHNTPTEKQIFTIKTTTLGDFKTDISTEKTATIQANSTLTIPAETAGKISKIFVKEGQKLRAGETIATLEDTFNNYDLALLQAKNRIATEQAGNETQIVNLENSVISAKMNYDKALLAYNQLMSQNNLKYDNLVKKNADQLRGIDDNYRSHLNNLDAMATQYLYEADKILGMTSENQHINNVFEAYLGVANWVGRSKSEDEWNQVYAMRGSIRARIEENKNFTEKDANNEIKLIEDGYEDMRKFANAMIEMLQNNVHGGWLEQSTTAAWLNQWNAARNTIANAESGFISWKNQTKNFLENYKNEELATKYANSDEAINAADFKELQENKDLKLAYDNADLATRQAIDNAKLSLEQAKTAWENAEKIKNSTIKQQSINLGNSEIALRQAERNASKLTIKAPINGIVTKITAEVGQSVNNGTTIIEFVGQEAEAIIEIDPRVALFLENGQEVTATIGDEKITGKISAISSVASQNLLSSVRISFANGDKFIGQTANISLNLPNNITPTFLLPLNSVKIISEGQGEIKILENGEIRSESVRLGAMYGSAIEIFTELDENITIILSDVSAYNSEKQELKVE